MFTALYLLYSFINRFFNQFFKSIPIENEKRMLQRHLVVIIQICIQQSFVRDNLIYSWLEYVKLENRPRSLQ